MKLIVLRAGFCEASFSRAKAEMRRRKRSFRRAGCEATAKPRASARARASIVGVNIFRRHIYRFDEADIGAAAMRALLLRVFTEFKTTDLPRAADHHLLLQYHRLRKLDHETPVGVFLSGTRTCFHQEQTKPDSIYPSPQNAYLVDHANQRRRVF